MQAAVTVRTSRTCSAGPRTSTMHSAIVALCMLVLHSTHSPVSVHIAAATAAARHQERQRSTIGESYTGVDASGQCENTEALYLVGEAVLPGTRRSGRDLMQHRVCASKKYGLPLSSRLLNASACALTCVGHSLEWPVPHGTANPVPQTCMQPEACPGPGSERPPMLLPVP